MAQVGDTPLMADSSFGLEIGDDAREASKDAKDACRLEGAVDELRPRWTTLPL